MKEEEDAAKEAKGGTAFAEFLFPQLKRWHHEGDDLAGWRHNRAGILRRQAPVLFLLLDTGSIEEAAHHGRTAPHTRQVWDRRDRDKPARKLAQSSSRERLHRAPGASRVHVSLSQIGLSRFCHHQY